MRWMMRLYPRAWRERYGDEFVALLDEHRLTLRLLVDIVMSAIDAHVHPQPPAATAIPTDSASDAAPRRRLVRYPLPPRCFTRRSAAASGLMLVAGVLVSLAAFAARQLAGPSALPQVIGVSAAPLAMLITVWVFPEAIGGRGARRGSNLLMSLGACALSIGLAAVLIAG